MIYLFDVKCINSSSYNGAYYYDNNSEYVTVFSSGRFWHYDIKSQEYTFSVYNSLDAMSHKKPKIEKHIYIKSIKNLNELNITIDRYITKIIFDKL